MVGDSRIRYVFFFSSRRRHTRWPRDWSSDRVLFRSNIGADPNDEPFSDGMSEELITALAKIAELRVTARTSAFSFKGKAVDVREIGSKLNVNYVLAGKIGRASCRERA